MRSKPAITPRHLFAASDVIKHVDALNTYAQSLGSLEACEAVHQMRVASRRLRNALNLFEAYLPARKVRTWKKRIARVTRALRDARDLDVQIGFLRRHADGLTGDEQRRFRPGIDRLLLRLNQQRSAVQPNLNTAVHRLKKQGTIEDIQRKLRSVQASGRAAHVDVNTDVAGMHLEAAKTIELRLEQVWVYVPYIPQPQYIRELHQMRLAVKHLRYTMESYSALFEHQLRSTIKLSKSVQTMLGDIHDCDVWIDFLPRFIEQERSRFQVFYGHAHSFGRLKHGLMHLLDNRRQTRDDLHRHFIEQWSRAESSGQWDALRSTALADHRPGRINPSEPAELPRQAGANR